MSKRKRTKPAQTKEQQAAAEGYIYVSGHKTIRAWDSVLVVESRARVPGDAEKQRAGHP